jgi:hypothetical protein
MIHKRAVPCPNVKALDANSHMPECSFCNKSGIMHYGEREIYGTFHSNSLQKTFEMHGVLEIGQAVVSLPTEYSDGTQADFNTFDKLIIPDFQVRLWELKEYESREDRKQFLRYPVKQVDFVSSVVNGTQKFYTKDVDFTVEMDGSITWIPGKEPSYDNVLDKGETIAWAYFANPEYVVMQNLRELRITQEMIEGQKVARRLPQQVLVKRDFIVNTAQTTSGEQP